MFRARHDAVPCLARRTGPQGLAAEPAGKAVYYTLCQWAKLTVFLTHADVPLDNNRCENAIRPFVIGRKGWMFSDTVPGAVASANLYSLVETALCRMRHSADHAERRTMPNENHQRPPMVCKYRLNRHRPDGSARHSPESYSALRNSSK
jgi:hypothetical protein